MERNAQGRFTREEGYYTVFAYTQYSGWNRPLYKTEQEANQYAEEIISQQSSSEPILYLAVKWVSDNRVFTIRKVIDRES